MLPSLSKAEDILSFFRCNYNTQAKIDLKTVFIYLFCEVNYIIRRNADGPHDIASLRKAVAAGIASERGLGFEKVVDGRRLSVQRNLDM